MTNLSVTSRLTSVRERIDAACQQSERPTDEVTLLAVSKTKPLANIVEAYEAGQRDFGENYAQEMVEKCQQSLLDDIQWHFIGPLQSNKSRPIAEHADWVHTIDRLKIAQRLSDQRPDAKPPLNVLIQVNISDDPAKAGVTPSQVEKLAEQIAQLPNLTLKGLMTITATGLNDAELAKQFGELKNLQLALIKRYSSCTEVSMGMSSDFELAIACGATMVRVGSDIFGARAPKTNSGA
jgi:pyridoxal phosphate enzyme (YggS family)